ncbi:MAG: cytochrome b/b6 domain-containing protein [Phycisphaerae bacterium]|nr:cytochrome b/b6 domain-containing protein [Phycisphaerae bacterium]
MHLPQWRWSTVPLREAGTAYAGTTIAIHWLTAAAIALAVALGLRMADVGGGERERVFTLHMSVGMAILFLTLLRISLRAIHRPPAPLASNPWQRRAAAATHALLYVLLIAVPAIGWMFVASSSATTPMPLFGFLPWPGALSGNQSLGDMAEGTHRLLAYGLCGLLLIHTSAAIWHHMRNADEGLTRILPGGRRLLSWQTSLIAATLVVLFLIGKGSADGVIPVSLRLVDGEARARLPAVIDPRKARVFSSILQPVLAEKCGDCHGALSQKGGLRLDSFASVIRGGDSGKAVVPGDSDESELVRRIMAPAGHKDLMPPSGRPALTPAEGQLLLWWVDRGADEAVTIRAASPTPIVAGILRAMGVSSESPALARIVPAPDPKVLAMLRASFQANFLFAGSGLLEVQRRFDGAAGAPLPIDWLAAFVEQIVWLDLSGVRANPKQLEMLARLRNLQRLNLAGTRATDDTVRALRDLPYMETLNLYGTEVTDAGLASLSRMPSLDTVYLDETSISAPAIERFRASHPQLQIVWQPALAARVASKRSTM